MRIKLLLPALCFAAVASFTEAKSKAIDLTGSWKETKRFTLKKELVSFTDTIRIEFLIGNEYVWHKDMGFAYRGTYKATDEVLDMGARTFNVLKMLPDRMVVKNEAGIHEFSRYTNLAEEDNSKATSTGRAFNKPAGSNIDPSKLSGRWEVYKRTSAVQQEKVDYDRILKTLDIKAAENNVTGEAQAAQFGAGKNTWIIERFEKNILYLSGPDKRMLKVLESTGKELVLQEDTITYFFKKF